MRPNVDVCLEIIYNYCEKTSFLIDKNKYFQQHKFSGNLDLISKQIGSISQKNKITSQKKEVRIDDGDIKIENNDEFEKLEKEIPDLEKEKKLLEVKLNNGTSGFERLQEISERISDIIVLIDRKEMRWLELSDKVR